MDQKSTTRGSVYKADPVPFVVHENMRACDDAKNLRLVRVIVFLVVLLVGTNMFWAFFK